MLNIYVINLKEREDRWNNIVNIFGKDFNLIRVDAIKHENGLIGCFLSHQKCLKIAKEKQLQNIIVMEDDCIVNQQCENYYSKTINEIISFLNNNNDEWDIFTGCCNKTAGENILKKINYNDDNNGIMIQINMASSSHFMIYNKSSYEFYLDIKNITCAIDRVWNYNLRAFTYLPFIFHQ